MWQWKIYKRRMLYYIHIVYNASMWVWVNKLSMEMKTRSRKLKRHNQIKSIKLDKCVTIATGNYYAHWFNSNEVEEQTTGKKTA